MEEQTCYLGDLIMTKVKKITKTLWYFQKRYLSEVEPYPTYPKNHHNKTKG